jgi:hypothetical protein
MDVLRSWPVSGDRIVLGEILAPLAVLAVIEGVLLVAGATIGFVVGGRWLTMGFVACGLVPVLPAVAACGLVLRNLLVLLLPSWAAPSAQETRGLEFVGQRLFMTYGTILALGIAIVPAGLAGGLVAFLLYGWLGMRVAPIAGLVGGVVAAAEAYAALVRLGWMFERFDVSRKGVEGRPEASEPEQSLLVDEEASEMAS